MLHIMTIYLVPSSTYRIHSQRVDEGSSKVSEMPTNLQAFHRKDIMLTQV